MMKLAMNASLGKTGSRFQCTEIANAILYLRVRPFKDSSPGEQWLTL
jgi:hypothetical protein